MEGGARGRSLSFCIFFFRWLLFEEEMLDCWLLVVWLSGEERWR